MRTILLLSVLLSLIIGIIAVQAQSTMPPSGSSMPPTDTGSAVPPVDSSVPSGASGSGSSHSDMPSGDGSSGLPPIFPNLNTTTGGGQQLPPTFTDAKGNPIPPPTGDGPGPTFTDEKGNIIPPPTSPGGAITTTFPGMPPSNSTNPPNGGSEMPSPGGSQIPPPPTNGGSDIPVPGGSTPPPNGGSDIPPPGGSDIPPPVVTGTTTTARQGTSGQGTTTTTARGSSGSVSTTTTQASITKGEAGLTTTTTAPPPTTTSAAPTTTTTAAPTTTAESIAKAVKTTVTDFTKFDLDVFKTKMASIIGIPATDLRVVTADDPSAGPNAKQLTIVIDSPNATANIAAQQKAMNMNATTQSSLGVSGSFAAATVPTTAGPNPAAEEKSNVPLIAGAAAGGAVLLIILLAVAKKMSSQGTGVSRVDEAGPEGGMLGSYEQEMNRHNGGPVL